MNKIDPIKFWMARIYISSLHKSRFTYQNQRYFSKLFGANGVQRFSACRTLPFQAEKVYELIADVDSYSKFLPFCKRSKVTKYHLPDNPSLKCPAEAILTIGKGGIEETFTSSIYCVPGSLVEALSGDAVLNLPRDSQQFKSITSHENSFRNDLFKHLRTKWTIQPDNLLPTVGSPKEMNRSTTPCTTKVMLDIEYQLLNPIYATLSGSFTPEICETMIKAFESRAFETIKGL